MADDVGRTPLQHAAINGRLAAARTLKDVGTMTMNIVGECWKRIENFFFLKIGHAFLAVKRGVIFDPHFQSMFFRRLRRVMVRLRCYWYRYTLKHIFFETQSLNVNAHYKGGDEWSRYAIARVERPWCRW